MATTSNPSELGFLKSSRSLWSPLMVRSTCTFSAYTETKFDCLRGDTGRINSAGCSVRSTCLRCDSFIPGDFRGEELSLDLRESGDLGTGTVIPSNCSLGLGTG